MTSTDARQSVALSAASLAALPPTVAVPRYDRTAVTVGIVHLGVGSFHRAHQARYLDDLMNVGEALDWGICGVGVLESDRRMRDVLHVQDCLYTLVEKHADGTRTARVIGSIVDYLFAPDDLDAVLDRMADPRVRVVSLTVTEGGYGEQAQVGPGSAFGLITSALVRRRREGTSPFTVLSCDNIENNGETARDALCSFAARTDRELGDWIRAHVRFPSSMVDRITPATTDLDRAELADHFGVLDAWPVVSEPFSQWVQQESGEARPPWEDAGVQIVPDVRPYELMKLRLLNASHQGLCYLGWLAGYRLVHEVAQDPSFRAFLLDYMEREATPTLAPLPGIDLPAYRRELLDRFANPHVRDTVSRLCAESSDRIPTWIVPVIRRNLADGGEVHRSAAVVASWARYAEGVDEQGVAYEVVDRRRDEVMARARDLSDPLAFLRDRELFGDLVGEPRFTEPYAATLASLHAVGARATLATLL